MPVLKSENYTCLDAEGKEPLEEIVNQLMKEGYKTAGGVQVVVAPGARYLQFFQAMYKLGD